MAYLVKCPKCGNNVSSEVKNCPKCGGSMVAPQPVKKPAPPYIIKCSLCGADIQRRREVPKDAQSCPSCGQKVSYHDFDDYEKSCLKKGICPCCGDTSGTKNWKIDSKFVRMDGDHYYAQCPSCDYQWHLGYNKSWRNLE